MKTLLKGTLLVGLASVGVATAALAMQADHGFNPASLDASARATATGSGGGTLQS